MTDLKPCPLCGGKPHVTECGMLDRYCCIVAHVESEHTVRVSAEAETKEKAKALVIEKWNRRAYE